MRHLRLAKQVFVRLLLAYSALLAAVQLFRGLLLPAIQTTMQLGDASTSRVRRTGIFLFAVLAYWGYVRLVEKRKVGELRLAPLPIALGAMSGSALVAISMLLLFAFGAYEMTATQGLQSGLLNVAGLILIAAVMEEIAYRCILFQILEKAWGIFPALCIQSLIFALGHIENVEGRASTAEMVSTVVSVTLLGALWTLVFMHSRSLWVTAANHAAWNFTIILAGVPLSGLEDWRSLAPMSSEYRGSAWLTGGIFGPESSIVTIILVAGSLAAMLIWASRKGLLIGDPLKHQSQG